MGLLYRRPSSTGDIFYNAFNIPATESKIFQLKQNAIVLNDINTITTNLKICHSMYTMTFSSSGSPFRGCELIEDNIAI